VLAPRQEPGIECEASLITSQRRSSNWLGLEARFSGQVGRPSRWAKSLKFVLDDDSKSGIEWQASLIESQLMFGALRRGEYRSIKTVGENEVKTKCLTRF
jgi:hypothetical protein